MNACMHARHLRPLLSSVLRYSLAHPTSSGAAASLLLLVRVAAATHPAYNSSWAAREQERRDWILKKDPENEIISGPPGPGAPPRG